MSFLELHGVASGYDFLQVLWEVTLHVEPGEFVALIGPNGAGKTTTLRTVAGLIKPMRGDIVFCGQPIGSMPAHEIGRLGVSYVSETLNLFGSMSVHENLLLGAFVVKAKQDRLNSLDSVYQLFPRLFERRGQLAGTLSGGERKMLAIGRGLMRSPSLLLVDEPSLGLAPLLTVAVFEALQSLRQRGVTVLLVEQNVHSTLRLVDRAYVLEQGRVVLEGRGSDLMNDEHVQQAYLGL